MFTIRVGVSLMCLAGGLACEARRDQGPNPPPSSSPSTTRPGVGIAIFGRRTLLPVKVGQKWGFVDRSGKSRIQPQFDSATPFIEGLAIVCVGRCATAKEARGEFGNIHRWEGKFGIIDGSGNYVANPQFDGLQTFSEGLAAACIGAGCNGFALGVDDKLEQRWGFVDTKGTLTIPYQFGRVQSFQEGLAQVCIGDCDKDVRWGYVDTSGKVVIAPQFDKADGFWDGIAEVQIGTSPNERRGYIDKSGRYIVNPQ